MKRNSRIRKKGPEPVDTLVGTRIRLQRMERGISQTKLADAIGVTFQQVQKYEKGVNRVGASRLSRIAEVLEVPVGSFFRADSQRGRSEQVEGHERYLIVPGAFRLLRAFQGIESAEARNLIVRLAEVISTGNQSKDSVLSVEELGSRARRASIE